MYSFYVRNVNSVPVASLESYEIGVRDKPNLSCT